MAKRVRVDRRFFWQGSDVLSNFYPCEFEMDGKSFACAEQAFMYLKALEFKDPIADTILKTPDPRLAKKLGRKVKGFSDAVWDKRGYECMVHVLEAKFNKLRDELLATGDAELIEASPFDRKWGIGFAATHPNANKPETWGTNLLGKALNEVRTLLRLKRLRAITLINVFPQKLLLLIESFE